MKAPTLEQVKKSVDYNLPLYLIGLLIVVLIPVVVWLARNDARELEAWKARCTEELGGRVVDKQNLSYGNNTKDGSVVITSSTDYYCLNPSGGILDIR